VSVGGKVIGWLGELHPRLQQKYELPRAPVVFELDADALCEAEIPAFREISKFPPVIRDRAMEFDENISVGAVLEEITRNRPAIVQDVRLFDVYRGDGVERGRKSLAFRVVMQDTARTLTDAEADAAMAQLTELLSARFGAKLRT
jgi:phenylalanyl-tRNA synthetase beta chain